VTCPQAPELGAYVLDALPPDERRRVAEHVERCPECAAELAGLAGLPALLAHVRPEDLLSGHVAPSPGLFDRIAEAARVRPVRRRRRLLVAAAAAALVVIGAVTVRALDDDPRTWTATSGQVQLSVTAEEARSGSALDVMVGGLSYGQQCELVVVDREGDHHSAGTWTASYSGDVSWEGWSAVAPSSLAEILLLDEDGRELARVRT
jgi:hypothetical protein